MTEHRQKFNSADVLLDPLMYPVGSRLLVARGKHDSPYEVKILEYSTSGKYVKFLYPNSGSTLPSWVPCCDYGPLVIEVLENTSDPSEETSQNPRFKSDPEGKGSIIVGLDDLDLSPLVCDLLTTIVKRNREKHATLHLDTDTNVETERGTLEISDLEAGNTLVPDGVVDLLRHSLKNPMEETSYIPRYGEGYLPHQARSVTTLCGMTFIAGSTGGVASDSKMKD